eukprot:746255-Amphidinium_carterae.1
MVFKELLRKNEHLLLGEGGPSVLLGYKRSLAGLDRIIKHMQVTALDRHSVWFPLSAFQLMRFIGQPTCSVREKQKSWRSIHACPCAHLPDAVKSLPSSGHLTFGVLLVGTSVAPGFWSVLMLLGGGFKH